MSRKKQLDLMVFAPESHVDIVRKATGEAGAGVVGNHKFYSFSVKASADLSPRKELTQLLEN